MLDKNLMTVTILASSDIHGFFMNWDYAKDQRVDNAGLSKISTIYKRIKKENPNSMILDCGDLIQGNNAEMFLHEEKFPGIAVINKIGYEIYNMGNHEFNFGMKNLERILGQFKGIPMMGNLYTKSGYRFMNGLYIKSFGPIKIAFISLTTPLVRHFEEKSGYLKDYIVEDAEIELKRLLEEVKSYDVQAIIGIFHMGENNENEIANSGVRDLLGNVEESYKIDAVFGGHMHQRIEAIEINDSIFMEPGSKGETLCRLDLTFDLDSKALVDKKPSLIEVDQSVESDPEIEKILEDSHQKIRNYVNEVVGRVCCENLRPKDAIRGISQVRISQTPISEFFLDVMLYYSKADVVALHIDSPYPQIPGGWVKRKHIYNSYSYSGGEITNYRVKVKDLKAYMEWSAAFFNQSKEGDFTISFNKKRLGYKYSTFDIFGNVKYQIDLRKPRGKRIIKLTRMDGSPLEDEQEIILGLNKFRMDYLTSDRGPLHGKSFDQVWSSLKDESFSFPATIRNLAIQYFKDLPNETYRPSKQKRWRLISHVDDDVSQKAIDLLNEGLLDYIRDEDGVDLSIAKNIYDELTPSEYKKINKKYNFLQKSKQEKMRIIDLVSKI
ncbi:MAG: 5'-nucleotidase C-terminal domain-containing protein [Tissierellia bacterium]|nr:5'-nucleotidase C-terminal domain-containing protein [Tissierellia bacterium]